MGLKPLLKQFFEDAWSIETCYRPWRINYNSRPKSYGQCVVTSLYVYAIFGGQIVRNKKLNHYWNILKDGTELDLTRDQFSLFLIYKKDEGRESSFNGLIGHWDTQKRFKKL